MKRFGFLLLMHCLLAFSGFAEVRLTQQVLDQHTGLLVHFPAGWNIDPENATFMVVNFPPGRRPPQLLVPMNDAQIAITRPPAGITSIAGWLRSDRVDVEHGFALRELTLTNTHFGLIRATVARKKIAEIPNGTLVIYLFEVGGRPMKAALIFRGWRYAGEYEETVRSMVETIAPPLH